MRGAKLQELPQIELDEYEHKYINHIALFQILIVSDASPSEAIYNMVRHFKTDNWLDELFSDKHENLIENFMQ